MQPDPTQPEVTATIGGKARQLRFDKRALFRLGAPECAEVNADVDAGNSYMLFRRACIWAWALMVERVYDSPEDLAAELTNEESHPLMEGINKAILGGREPAEGEQGDPLLPTGPSPAEGSASPPGNTGG